MIAYKTMSSDVAFSVETDAACSSSLEAASSRQVAGHNVYRRRLKASTSMLLRVLILTIVAVVACACLSSSPFKSVLSADDAEAEQVTMTRHDRHSYGTGYAYATFDYTANGYSALCLVPEANSPRNEKAERPYYGTEYDNEMLRRCLYYSSAGPGGLNGAGAYSGSVVVSHMLVSLVYAYINNGNDWNAAYDTALYRTDYRRDSYKSLVDAAWYYATDTSHSVPDDWTVFVAYNNGGATRNLQPMVYGKYVPKYGSIVFAKYGDGHVHGLSAWGAVANARYGLYKDSGCTDLYREFTTGDDGTQTITGVLTGSYYCKEISAPWPYLTSDKITPVTVAVNGTAYVSAEDDSTSILKVRKTSLPADCDSYPLDGPLDVEYESGKHLTVTAKTENMGSAAGDATVTYTVTFTDGTTGTAYLSLPDQIECVSKTKTSGNGRVSVLGNYIDIYRPDKGQVFTITCRIKNNGGYGWDVDDTSADLIDVKSSNMSDSDVLGSIRVPLNGKKAEGTRIGIYGDMTCSDSSKVGELMIGEKDSSGSYLVADDSGQYGMENGQYLQPSTTYYVKELPNGNVNGYSPSSKIWSFSTGSASSSISIDISDSFSYPVIVKKSLFPQVTENDITKYSLAGAEFTLYMTLRDAQNGTNVKGKMVTGDGTGNDSIARLSGTSLLNGQTYYVKETKAPNGFCAYDGEDDGSGNGGIMTVKINSNSVSKLEVSDTVPFKMQVKKSTTDANTLTLKNMYSLADARFGVYKTEDEAKSALDAAGKIDGDDDDAVSELLSNAAGSFTTHEDGSTDEIELPLKSDGYYVAEVKAPKNYEPCTDVMHVSADDIINAGLDYTLQVKDEPKKLTVSIGKTSRFEGTDLTKQGSIYSLEGATIGIYDSYETAAADKTGASAIQTVTTDATGKAPDFTGLAPAGKYYYKEISAPSSKAYQLNGSIFEADFETTGVIEQKGSIPEDVLPVKIRLTKNVDSDDADYFNMLKEAGLASTDGLKFGVYTDMASAVSATEDNPGSPVDVMTLANDNTTVESKLLEYRDKYYVKELTGNSALNGQSDPITVDFTYQYDTYNGDSTDYIVKPEEDADGTASIVAKTSVDDTLKHCYVKIHKKSDGIKLPHDGYTLAGAIFGLYSTKAEAQNATRDNIGKPIYCLITQEETITNPDGTSEVVGTATSGMLPEGDYWLKELEAPAGFAAQSSPIKATAKETTDDSGVGKDKILSLKPYDNEMITYVKNRFSDASDAVTSSSKAALPWDDEYVDVKSASNDATTGSGSVQNALGNDDNINGSENIGNTGNEGEDSSADDTKQDSESIDKSQHESSISANENSNANDNAADATGDNRLSSDDAVAGSKRLIALADSDLNVSDYLSERVEASGNGKYVYDVDGMNAADVKKALEACGAKSVSSADISFRIADDTSVSGAKGDAEVSSGIDDSVAVGAADQDVPDYSGQDAIAVIDTGATENVDGVIGRYSVLGDNGNDDNGHGSSMARIIHEQYPDAKIVSIKALNGQGVGSIASVVSAMDLAVKMHARIINLSISAKATEDNAVMSDEVAKAFDNGCTVVGAAGNDGDDASNYIPGGIGRALIAGACDETGNKISSSNFGSTVDFYVKASSTSEASARLSAIVAQRFSMGKGLLDADVSDTVFVPSSADKYEKSVGYDGSGDDGLFRTQADVTGDFVITYTSSTFTVYYRTEDADNTFASKSMKMFVRQFVKDQSGNITDTVTSSADCEDGYYLVNNPASSGKDTSEQRPYNLKFTFDKGQIDYANENTYMQMIQYTDTSLKSSGAFVDGSNNIAPWTNTPNVYGQLSNMFRYGNWSFFDMWIGKIEDEACGWPYLHLDLNGGTREPDTSTSADKTTDLLIRAGSQDFSSTPAPTRTGYDFNGMYDKATYDNSGSAKTKKWVYTPTGDGSMTYTTTGEDFPADGGTGDYRIPPKWYVANLKSFTKQYDGTIDAPAIWVRPFSATVVADWTPHKYTVKFNKNTFAGEDVADMAMTYDVAGTLPSPNWKKTGYKLTGWNTKADGTGEHYDFGASVSNLTADNGATVNLYAEYQPISFTINYSIGAAGSQSDYTQTGLTYGTEYSLDANKFTRDGYIFTGWNTKRNGGGSFYTDNQKIEGGTGIVPDIVDGSGNYSTTLYAQWVPENIDVPLEAQDISDDAMTTGLRIIKESAIDSSADDIEASGTSNLMYDYSGAIFAVYGENWDNATTKESAISAGRADAYDAKYDETTGAVSPAPSFDISKTTTGSDGKITLSGLQAGNHYFVKEVKAPDGFALDDTVYEATTELNVLQDVVVKDKPSILAVDINKSAVMYGKDANSSNVAAYVEEHPLSEARFALYKTEDEAKSASSTSVGNPVAQAITDDNGHAVFDSFVATQDSYYMKELQAPVGYMITADGSAPDPVKVSLSDCKKTDASTYTGYAFTESVSNYIDYGSLKITKSGSVSGAPLDAEYGLFTSEALANTHDASKAFRTVKLDSSTGTGVIDEIPVGEYHLAETARPSKDANGADRYKMDDMVYSVIIGSGTSVTKDVSVNVEEPTADDMTIGVRKTVVGNSAFPPDMLVGMAEGVQYTAYTDEACMNVAKTVDGADAVMTIGSDGMSELLTMPNGTYYVKETKHPDTLTNDAKGVQKISGVSTVIEGEDHVTTEAASLSIKIQKTTNYADGDGANHSLAGAQFNVYYDEACTNIIKIMKNNNSSDITNENGIADISVPGPGTYYVKEVKPAPGCDLQYNQDGTPKVWSITVSPGSANVLDTGDGTGTVLNRTGYVAVRKQSSNTGISDGNSNYSLAGAVYGVYPDSACAGTRVATLTTKEDGSSDAVGGLKSGTYYAREESAPRGFDIDSTVHELKVDSNVNGADNPAMFTSIDSPRVGYMDGFTKVSAETMSTVVPNSARISGAEFTVIWSEISLRPEGPQAKPRFGYSAYAANETSNAATRTWVLVSDSNGYVALDDAHLKEGSDELFRDENGDPCLPIGYIRIQETKAPEGMVIDGAQYFYDVNGGSNINVNNSYSLPNMFSDKLQRGSLKITKTDANTGKVMANVPFLITLMSDKDGDGEYETPVESHVVFTDSSGTFSTEAISHSAGTNGNDSLIDGDFDSVTAGTARLKSTVTTHQETEADGSTRDVVDSINDAEHADDGVWFYGTDNRQSYVDDSLGALVPGHYRVDEVRSVSNDGYDLSIGNEIVVNGTDSSESSKDAAPVQVSAVNHSAKIESTSAVDKATGTHQGDGGNSSKIIKDTITYSGAVVGQEYTFLLSVYDKSTGNEAGSVNDSGNVTIPFSGSKTITADSESGSVDVEIDVSDGDYEGDTDLTVVASVMQGDNIMDTHNVNLTDTAETVSYRKITTQAVDAGNGSHVASAMSSDGTHTVTDTITYSNLVPGKKYNITGYLHKREAGSAAGEYVDGGVLKDASDNDVTASGTFTPTSANGTTSITYTMNMGSNWNGADTVSFDYVTEADTGASVCEHADISSDEQLVRYLSLKTTALDDETGEHTGEIKANDMGISFTDTVEYAGLVPGAEYALKMTLMNKTTGEAVKDASGKEVTVTKSLTPESDSGTTTMSTSFTAGSAKDVADCVVFEELSKDGSIVASHKDLGDADQELKYADRSALMLPFTGMDGLLGIIVAALASVMLTAAYKARNRNDEDEETRGTR